MTGKGSFRPKVKVQLVAKEAFFGPGPKTLMLRIRENGSVLQACEKMGISYSKGRSIIRTMEKELGFELVNRVHGGRDGGKATLTEEGETFLKAYLDYENRIVKYAEEVFDESFGIKK